MAATQCAIWGTPAIPLRGYEERDGVAFDSPRAGGRYFLSGSAASAVQALTEQQKVALTHEIVENNALGSIASISTQTISALPEYPTFLPQARAGRLLEYLIRSSDYLGKKIVFPKETVIPSDPDIFYIGFRTGAAAAPLFAWSDSLNEEEVWFLLSMLADQNLIKAPTGSAIDEITVLPAGYARFEQDSSAHKSDQAFVAMWFDQSMQEPYEKGVEGAVRECGFRPLRIDRKEHNNRIDDEIIGEIRKSKFLIADFTSNIGSPRGGVYFEAGFALGLGLPVIWTCRSDLMNHIHFDTRQFNHIVWTNADELKRGLKNRILATIGQGPA
ncbi:hypothetical protein [Sphingopyxis lindanitolerans]|uniref:hypothetical protein n=1 Tax=Sphingopyxis lindanitolerans TaxID=2054227 RepID=UPI0011B211C4|nr:hypothetical protein [Sphingopyxis lindanitolerans]